MGTASELPCVLFVDDDPHLLASLRRVVRHLRPALGNPEFLGARGARVKNDKIVAQPFLFDDLRGPGFRGCGQLEVNLT